jgi:hypothetical protein
MMSDPFFPAPDPWQLNPHHDTHESGRFGLFDDPLIDMGFPFDRGFDDMMNPGNGRTRVFSQVTRGSVGPDGRWVSESRMTRTVNGVTESIWKRKDGVVCVPSHYIPRVKWLNADAITLLRPGQRVRHIHLSRRARTAHCQRP